MSRPEERQDVGRAFSVLTNRSWRKCREHDIVYPIAITLSGVSFQSSPDRSAKNLYGRFKSTRGRGLARARNGYIRRNSARFAWNGETRLSGINGKFAVRCTQGISATGETAGWGLGGGKFIGPAWRTDVLSGSFYWRDLFFEFLSCSV